MTSNLPIVILSLGSAARDLRALRNIKEEEPFALKTILLPIILVIIVTIIISRIKDKRKGEEED